jgi:DNA-binding PucR family transcriptional regulator
MSLACGCRLERARQPHVALALRAAALDSMPRLWEVMADFFGTRACAMQYVAGRVLALLPQAALTRWETWFGHLAASVGPVSGGLSAAYTGEAGIEHAQDEALSALLLGERLRGPGHLTAYADVFPLDYATYLVDDPRLRGIYDNVVSRLAIVAQPDRGELLGTLDTYLATGCAPGATAACLGIHRNTVLYRIRRILEVTDLHLEDAEERFLVQLALRAYYRLAHVNSPGYS